MVNEQLVGVNPGIFGGPTFGLVAFGDRKFFFSIGINLGEYI